MNNRRLVLGAWWALAGACVFIGSAAVVTVPSPSTAIDIGRIEDHVAVVADVPHPMGSAANDAVRRYLEARLEAAGLVVLVQEFIAPDYYGGPDTTVTGVNIVARAAGVDHSRAVLLVAHYDSVPATPGANDNAAAVGALLEVGRIVGATSPPNDVILLLTDGEEPAPRFGAEAFTRHVWFPDVAVVANFEAIGAAGPTLLVETAGPRETLIEHLSRARDGVVAFSFVTDATDLLGEIGTDFDVFRAQGIPGYNFAYIRDSSVYHTERDDVAALGAEGAGSHASIALGLATRGVPKLDPIDEAIVFFTLPGGALVRFGDDMARVLTVGAALMTAFVTGYRIRRGDTTVGLIARGLLRTITGFLLVGVAGTVMWLAIGGLRPGMRGPESAGWLVFLVGTAGVASWLVNRGRRDPVTGALILWAALAVLAIGPLPGLATAFAVPALIAGAAAVYATHADGLGHRVIRVITVSLAAGLMVVPAIDTFFQLAVPRPGNPDSELLAVVAIPVMLAFLVITLVATTINPPEVVRTNDAEHGDAPHPMDATRD